MTDQDREAEIRKREESCWNKDEKFLLRLLDESRAKSETWQVSYATLKRDVHGFQTQLMKFETRAEAAEQERDALKKRCVEDCLPIEEYDTLKSDCANFQAVGGRLAQENDALKSKLNEMGYVEGGINWYRRSIESDERNIDLLAKMEALKARLFEMQNAAIVLSRKVREARK